MKVLIIEDSRLLCRAIARLLTKVGHEVFEAGDGKEGLCHAQEDHPDLIVLDLMLPGLEGARVLQSLKQSPETEPIPVIVLSGLSQRNEQKLRELGAAAYIEKSLLDVDAGGTALLEVLNLVTKKAKRSVGAS